MTYEEAARILRDSGYDVRSHKLENNSEPFIDTHSARDETILDGEFTADQLEAIATWMRNPVEVASA